MRFVYKCSVLGAACFLAVYGCHSGDDDTGGQAGSPSAGGGGKAGSGGTAGAKPGSGGSAGKASGGEGGQVAGAAGHGEPADSGGAAPAGAGGQPSEGPAGNGSGAAGAAGATGEAGAGSTPCIKDVTGRYVIRHDGAALYEPNSGTERIIVDATSGAPLENVRAVADGSYHGCAVLADESVVCWQTNNAYGNQYGQLGNGTTDSNTSVYRATPVLTAADTPLTGIVGLAEIGPGTQNENTACAVSGDGKLWCWGELTWIANNGTSLRTGYAQPITLDGDMPMTGVIQAAVTKEFACALRSGSANGVWCWGYNASGELAQPDLNRRQYPTEVTGLTAPTRVVASNASSGENTACAIDDGKVRCWGYNGTPGAVGGKLDSTTFDVQVPTLVVLADGSTPLDGVTDLRSGLAQFVALRDGALWIWGGHTQNYAANYGTAAVTLVGSAGGLSNTYGPRYVTSDGEYHDNKVTLPVTCSGNP